MNAFSEINKVYQAGHRTIVLSGNYDDYAVVDGQLVSVMGFLKQKLAADFRLLEFSKSQGLKIYQYNQLQPNERQALDKQLCACGLKDLQKGQITPEDQIAFVRGFRQLAQMQSGSTPIATLLYNTEFFLSQDACGSEELNFVFAEILQYLSTCPAIAKSGNLIVCLTHDGFEHPALCDMHRIELSVPDEGARQRFLDYFQQANSKAEVSTTELTPQVARLTSGMPIKTIRQMLLDIQAQQRPLAVEDILETKSKSILRASDGALSLLRTALCLDDIVGHEAIKRFFLRVGELFKLGDPAAPRFMIWLGPPGVGKTVMAPIFASLIGFNCLKFGDVKSKWLGESEKRQRRVFSLFEQWQPVVPFIDEFTEAVPSRQGPDTDGGTSMNMLSELLSFSSREDLRAKVCFIAASNFGRDKIDVAFLDRANFVVPFLELMPSDIATLMEKMSKKYCQTDRINSRNELIIKAATLAHKKGASPRKIVDILATSKLIAQKQELQPAHVLAAVEDFTGAGNPDAVAFTSLSAISLVNYKSLYPWSVDVAGFVLPWYLEGLVDRQSGEVDKEQLETKMIEYRRKMNS